MNEFRGRSVVDGETRGSSFASASLFSIEKERRSSAESERGRKEQEEIETLTEAERFNTLGGLYVQKFRKTMRLNV